MEALALRLPNGSEDLPAKPVNNPYSPRKNPSIATGVMIHVGGKFNGADGVERTMGSFGCFGLCKKDRKNLGMEPKSM